MKRVLVVLILLLVVLGAGAWWWEGRGGPPKVQVNQPAAVIGRMGTVDLLIDAPGGRLSKFDIIVEQGGKQTPIHTLQQPAGATLRQAGPDRVQLTAPLTPKEVPDLRSGEARLIVRAERTALRGFRVLGGETTKTFRVQLEPPRVGVLSTHHYINLGGSEFVVFRATPADAAAGVRVGDRVYPAFPGSAVGITADSAVRVAVFALLYDQDLNTPISVFATDAAGNTASVPLDFRAFPKVFRRSRIEVSDAFLQHVVPAILENTPDFAKEVADPNDLVAAFLKINGDLRRKNAETIAAYAKQTAPERLWDGIFQQLGNSQVEASFADHRTYFHDGKEIDQQVHLGFDLAVTSAVPVVAANNGKVVHAGYLGIYGNCVIIDHGLGVQSLYAHLSSMEVQPGAQVSKGQQIGRSGMTGLAGGDHLHFSMLVNGQAVNAVEWWDKKWMEDRVLRKIRDAGGKI
jgi:murein DD-endopeptidase MepM/ murein hydrolase activator NlpD